MNPLELYDNKTIRAIEFFDGLEISSATNILCNSVENADFPFVNKRCYF